MRIDFRNPLGCRERSGDSNAPTLVSSAEEAFSLGALLCYSGLTDEDLEPRRPIDRDDIHQVRENLCAVLLLELQAAAQGERPSGWINDNLADCPAEDDELASMVEHVPINVDPEGDDCEFLARWRLSHVDGEGNLRFVLQTALSSEQNDWHRLVAFDVPIRLMADGPDHVAVVCEHARRTCRWAHIARWLEDVQDLCRQHRFYDEYNVLSHLIALSRLDEAAALSGICNIVRMLRPDLDPVLKVLG
jgi:hypothetical protein